MVGHKDFYLCDQCSVKLNSEDVIIYESKHGTILHFCCDMCKEKYRRTWLYTLEEIMDQFYKRFGRYPDMTKTTLHAIVKELNESERSLELTEKDLEYI